MSATKILSLALTITLFGCSSLSTKEKVVLNSTIAGAAGYTYGEHKETNKNSNALLYGSMFALGASIASIYFFDPDSEKEKYRTESIELKKKLDEFQNPRLVVETNSFQTGKVPLKYKNMIEPGSWKIYEIDEWVEDGENRLIHQDKLMELTPPLLKPNNKTKL
ncbi:MAG: hypothetical protein JNM24_17400 [Bdellovibrionaceae bacterium]|nr:hypothetical protein [Pseudobdellovibrionaceae bacterium]